MTVMSDDIVNLKLNTPSLISRLKTFFKSWKTHFN
jgi:hypothetical protein